MGQRHDAGAAAAEMVLAVERRCSQAPTLVGTVGRLAVPNGAVNVIPGRCEFSLDIRAADDATKDAAVADIFRAFDEIAARRGVAIERHETMRAPAAPCAPRLREALADAVAAAGIRPFALPSGAGHDAMVFSGVTDIGMLFVRCGNGGASHNPQETVTAADADVAARVMLEVLFRLA
jgi:beta-ureidopropionase / N-carbamoyl-L-amino-acid hydrolase